MPKNINPFAGKKVLGSNNSNKAPRRGKHGKPKGARQKRNGSSWGLVGVVASAAAVWLFGAWQIGQNKAKKAGSDASYLTQMLTLPLKYTEHAQCRMECRRVSEREVRSTLKKGSINARKSDLAAFPCPKVVVDASVGRMPKNVQAVFSACPLYTGVVTVIDKDTDWECYCP
ncbi:hypothetical protein CVIRNUC_001957 [Coccomyxa viridis]|uniref:Uncharacterized protein n=1 Tax=Coccomyxa viridis TaxID=1274662 RepID=A0AAV1HUM0_9CHLO|nr:hypothetical protein CVIRNUC_001957 [Coccomyxa viridis]